jgi:hypothetical protein
MSKKKAKALLKLIGVKGPDFFDGFQISDDESGRLKRLTLKSFQDAPG